MGQLLFVRHGQASLLKTYYDDLSDHGREQALALGSFFAEHGWGFDAVYAGPARRHLDTANAVGKAVGERELAWPEVQTLPGLDEHDNLSLVRASVGSLSDDAEVVALRRDMLEAHSREERSERFQRLFEAVMIRWLRGDFEPQGVETWTQFRARVLSCLEAVTSGEPSIEDLDQLAGIEHSSRIADAIMRLPDAQRGSIYLAFYRGWTHEEISSRQSVPLGTVKSRIRTGMEKLRDLLSAERKERIA